MFLLNTHKAALRWTDLDAYGHLNNAVFLNFMTEARADLFKELLKINNICQFVVVHVECDYKIPFLYPDCLIVKQYLEQKGNSSFVLKYEFFSENKPEVLHAYGAARMVAYDSVVRKPVRLPKQLMELLEK